MIYTIETTIPANTDRENKNSDTLIVSPGNIKRIEIFFPSGCAGLVGTQIFYQTHQLFPTNPGGYFIADNRSIPFTPDVEIKDNPTVLEFLSYNLDDTYSHTVYFWLEMEQVKSGNILSILTGRQQVMRGLFDERLRG